MGYIVQETTVHANLLFVTSPHALNVCTVLQACGLTGRRAGKQQSETGLCSQFHLQQDALPRFFSLLQIRSFQTSPFPNFPTSFTFPFGQSLLLCASVSLTHNDTFCLVTLYEKHCRGLLRTSPGSNTYIGPLGH